MTNTSPARANLCTRAAVLLIAALSLPFAAAQQPEPAKPQTLLQRLEKIEFAANFQEAPLGDWAEYLAQLCGMNMIVDQSAAAIDPERTTLRGLKLPKTSVRRVLDVIQALTDLHWRCEGENVLRISAASAASPASTTIQVRMHGSITKPGLRKVARTTTLLDLILASAPLTGCDLGAICVTRSQGKAQRQFFVDVEAMMQTGATEQNLLLMDGDVIAIPDLPPADLPPLTLRVGSDVRFVLDAPAGHEKLLLLEQPQRVQRDGTIFVPFVGNIAVLGMDRDETAEAVMKALAPLLAQAPKVWARFD